MWRSKENHRLFFIQVLISILATVLGFILSKETGMLTLMTTVLLIVITFIFTRWRYKEIKELTKYLHQISSGNYSLDVRDHREGELSILKSEIYKVTNILSEQTNHLEQNKQHLTTAISDISHQLKTPLTSMTVMADLLYDTKLPLEKRREFIQNIHTQLERLNGLVTSLLKLSKIDSGTILFKKEQIKVADLMSEVIQSFHMKIDVKQPKVMIDGSPSAFFIGDFQWTKEALINLIKNCFEHTDDGGKIKISFSENVLYTEILIKDEGIGIPAEDLPYIFQRFYKGKYASEESIGIGLAMAHQIISKQGGDIDVSSVENEGTQFRIKFYHPVHSCKNSLK